MSEPKKYEYVSDGYTARFLNPQTGHAAPYGEYVLHSDYARLRAEVEMHSKPAIIGGYNLSQYIRMANSETLEFDNGDIFADMTLPERIKYIVESHARLRSVNEDNKRECEATRIENARLKAEVERLTLENSQYEEHHKYGQNVITSLREEVDRLTKAGDAMAKLLSCCGNPQSEVRGWNAAKGVQS
jgi:predicted RNase H-like nuclease (RuvC/YqgF family)